MIDQSLISNVQSRLHRLEQEFEFIRYGPTFGHRFPLGPHRGDAVFCILCKEPFDLVTDSRIPCPRTPCPETNTNEAEKSERTAQEAQHIHTYADELAFHARILMIAEYAERDRQRKVHH